MWDLIVSVPDHCLSFYLGWAGPYLVIKRVTYLEYTIPKDYKQ